jgi:hypothetical protein
LVADLPHGQLEEDAGATAKILEHCQSFLCLYMPSMLKIDEYWPGTLDDRQANLSLS